MKLAGLRLNGIPIPPAVRDRRFRKVRFGGSLRNLRNRPDLRPLQRWICCLAIESLKSRNPHSRIYQRVVNFFRPYDNNIRLCNSRRTHSQHQQSEAASYSSDPRGSHPPGFAERNLDQILPPYNKDSVNPETKMRPAWSCESYYILPSRISSAK